VKILITGGFGYVGGRLGMHLASSPLIKLYLGSRAPRARPDWLRQGEVVEMDWGDNCNLIAACQNMDVIVHTAGMNAQDCIINPTMALEVNGMATERLITSALKNEVSKFIYMSTAHVYASDLSGLITEDNEVLNLHPYATSHVVGERAAMNGHSQAGMQSVVVRLANAFGAPSRPDANCWRLVVNDLCRQAVVDRSLVIKGPSNVVRNFISMTDACLAIEHLICDRKAFESPLICNLGGSQQTILDIAYAIKKIFAKNTEIILPLHEMSEPRPSTNTLDFRSLILEQMGHKPPSDFKGELSRLIKFCEFNFRSDYAG